VHVLGVPVLVVLDHEHVLLRLPLLEDVGAVGDNVTRLGPVVAVLVDGPLRERPEGIVRRHVDEVGRRPEKGVLERVVVDRLDADVVEIGVLAGVEGIGALDHHGGHVGVIGGGGGIENALHGVDEVAGRDRMPVGPLGLAQLEGDGEPVGADRVGLGDARIAQVGFRVVLHEPFEQAEVHIRGGHVAQERRIYRRLRGVGHDELGMVGRLSLPAGHEQQRRRGHESEKDWKNPFHTTSYVVFFRNGFVYNLISQRRQLFSCFNREKQARQKKSAMVINILYTTAYIKNIGRNPLIALAADIIKQNIPIARREKIPIYPDHEATKPGVLNALQAGRHSVQLKSIASAQFARNIGKMVFNSFLAEFETCRDLLGALSGRKQAKNVQFAIRKP
jgi:hypothetical protein